MSPKTKIKFYLFLIIWIFLLTSLWIIKNPKGIIKIRDRFLCERISDKKKLANFLQSFEDDRYDKFSYFDQPYSYGYFNFPIDEGEIAEFLSQNPSLLGRDSGSNLHYQLQTLLASSRLGLYNKKPVNFEGYSIIYNETTYVPIVIIPSTKISLKEEYGERTVYTIDSDLGDSPKYNLTTKKIIFTITKCGNYIEDKAYPYPRIRYLNWNSFAQDRLRWSNGAILLRQRLLLSRTVQHFLQPITLQKSELLRQVCRPKTRKTP